MLLVALMPEHDPRQVRSPMATETSWEPVMVACLQDVDVSVTGKKRRWRRRTGLLTSTTNESPSDSVVLGAGAAMVTLCAAAEATSEARAKMAVRMMGR